MRQAADAWLKAGSMVGLMAADVHLAPMRQFPGVWRWTEQDEQVFHFTV